MKKIKLQSAILALGLIVGLAGCGANTSAPSAPPTEAPPTEAPPTEVAPTEVVSEVSTSAGAEGRSRAINTTENTTQSPEKMNTFKDEATSLSFQYPATWKTGSSKIPPTLPDLDTTLICSVTAPKDEAFLAFYIGNMDLETGDTFKSMAKSMAESMSSQEQLDAILPSAIQSAGSPGMKVDVVDIRESVPIIFSGNTFYRVGYTFNMEIENSKHLISVEYIMGSTKDQFFIFVGRTLNEKNYAALDAIINSISFEK